MYLLSAAPFEFVCFFSGSQQQPMHEYIPFLIPVMFVYSFLIMLLVLSFFLSYLIFGENKSVILCYHIDCIINTDYIDEFREFESKFLESADYIQIAF